MGETSMKGAQSTMHHSYKPRGPEILAPGLTLFMLYPIRFHSNIGTWTPFYLTC